MPLFTTDKAIFVTMGGADYFAALRRRARLAWGSDGALSAWTLTATTPMRDLAAYSMPTGSLGKLTPATPKDVGDIYVAIQEADPPGLILQHAEQDAGVGQPLEDWGVAPWTYEFASAAKLIQIESDAILRFLALQSADELNNPTDPERLCQLRVAARVYFAAAQKAGSDRDTYWEKYRNLLTEIRDEEKRLKGEYTEPTVANAPDFAVFTYDAVREAEFQTATPWDLPPDWRINP